MTLKAIGHEWALKQKFPWKGIENSDFGKNKTTAKKIRVTHQPGIPIHLSFQKAICGGHCSEEGQTSKSNCWFPSSALYLKSLTETITEILDIRLTRRKKKFRSNRKWKTYSYRGTCRRDLFLQIRWVLHLHFCFRLRLRLRPRLPLRLRRHHCFAVIHHFCKILQRQRTAPSWSGSDRWHSTGVKKRAHSICSGLNPGGASTGHLNPLSVGELRSCAAPKADGFRAVRSIRICHWIILLQNSIYFLPQCGDGVQEQII